MFDTATQMSVFLSRRAVLGTAATAAGAMLLPASKVAAQTARPAVPSASPPIAIRSFAASAAGVFRVTYAVESETGFVVVDAPLRKSDGTAVREWIATLGKPIRGVIITHAHGDHNFGVTQMLGGADVPIVATKAVTDAIRATEEGFQKFAPTIIGAAETERDRRFPNTFAESGKATRVDGVEFILTDLGEAESASDAVLTLPAHPTAMFVGDMVMPRVHQFLGNGTTGKLILALRRLTQIATPDMLAYPGHSGIVPLRPAIERQIAYIEAYRAAIREVAKGKPQLTDADKTQVATLIQRFEPTKTLEFVIALGADAVAKELAGS